MIKLRPHHLICNLCFQGKGYSDDFVKNFATINQQLQIEPDSQQIKIVDGADDICCCCPHLQNGKCKNESKVAILDNVYKQKLQLKIGDKFSLSAIIARVQLHLTMQLFHQSCAACEWSKFGICESQLKSYLTKGNENDK